MFVVAIDKNKGSGSSKGGFGGGLKLGGGFLGGGKASEVPLEFVPLLKTHGEISEKTSSVTIATGSANTEFQRQFEAEQLPAAPVYAARLSSLLKTLDTADIAVKGAIEARKSHIRNIERMLEQSKAALAKDEQTAADLAGKKKRTESTKASVEQLILEGMEENSNSNNNNGNNSSGSGDRGGTPGGNTTPDGLKSPEIEALTPPAQVQYEPEPPVPASELHHRHSIAPSDPPNPPAEFHAGASELLASLSGSLLNGSGLKRPQTEEGNVYEGLDEDLVNILKKEGAQQQQHQQRQQHQQQKRQKFEPQADDEYVP